MTMSFSSYCCIMFPRLPQLHSSSICNVTYTLSRPYLTLTHAAWLWAGPWAAYALSTLSGRSVSSACHTPPAQDLSNQLAAQSRHDAQGRDFCCLYEILLTLDFCVKKIRGERHALQ